MGLARAHRIVGWVTLAAFVGTGFYLKFGLPAPDAGNTWLHFAFRSNHIYILMAALLNLGVGLYVSGRARARVQRAGSWLILAAPAVLLIAFVLEPARGSLSRPLTEAGVVMLAAGTILHALSGRGGAREASARAR